MAQVVLSFRLLSNFSNCYSMKEHKITATARRKGIYLLPNLLTTGGLFSGFYAVVASMNGLFETAAVAIFIAMIFDALDGRVARITNTQSEFGAEYDSMADIVSFGIAPALVVYNWALSGSGKFGWLAAFIFVACGALRLARFNTQVGTADKRFFQGLAIPAAAAIVASLVWFANGNGVNGQEYGYIVGSFVTIIGLLMVSNFRYNSFKDVNWRSKVSFVSVLITMLVIVVVAAEPAAVLFAVFTIYAISGPVNTIRSVNKLKLEHVVGDGHDDDADFEESDKADKKTTSDNSATSEEDTIQQADSTETAENAHSTEKKS